MKTNVYMGFHQEDITPQKPVQLVGYDARPDNRSRGIMHTLTAQTLVWKTKAETGCLITIDSLGFTVDLTNNLRKKIADILNTKPGKIMVCFSHTHAAPNAALEPEYYQSVCEKIAASANQAIKNLFPSQAAWGIAENTIGVNRRGSKHPIDDRLGVLKICDAKHGNLKVIILRVTAHANVLMPDNYQISPDYFGTTRDMLVRKYGCKVMLIQGAAGNVRPKFRQENADFLEIHPAQAAELKISEAMKREYFNQSMKSLENMANAIYEAVEHVIDNIAARPIEVISMFSVKRTFYADVPAMDQAKQIADEALKNAGIDGSHWLQEVERLLQEDIKQQSSDVEIQYFVLDNGCLCGIPNEAMSEIAVEIMKKASSPYIFFNGYTNGCSSYLATADEYDQGGYEVIWSNLLYYPYHKRVMSFNRDTAQKLADNIVNSWKQWVEGKVEPVPYGDN